MRRPAISIEAITNGSLLAQNSECSPRHIWLDMPASIYQPKLSLLHECVDENNFKNARLLGSLEVIS